MENDRSTGYLLLEQRRGKRVDERKCQCGRKLKNGNELDLASPPRLTRRILLSLYAGDLIWNLQMMCKQTYSVEQTKHTMETGYYLYP